MLTLILRNKYKNLIRFTLLKITSVTRFIQSVIDWKYVSQCLIKIFDRGILFRSKPLAICNSFKIWRKANRRSYFIFTPVLCKKQWSNSSESSIKRNFKFHSIFFSSVVATSFSPFQINPFAQLSVLLWYHFSILHNFWLNWRVTKNCAPDPSFPTSRLLKHKQREIKICKLKGFRVPKGKREKERERERENEIKEKVRARERQF